MSVFAKALEDGFSAARNAELAWKEIDSVFSDLNEQVRKATGNKVGIRLSPISRMSSGAKGPYGHKLNPNKNDHIFVKNGAIVVTNRTTTSNTFDWIAQFGAGDSGYPFKISWNKRTNICEDKEALIKCLAELLRDPSVGRKIIALKGN